MKRRQKGRSTLQHLKIAGKLAACFDAFLPILLAVTFYAFVMTTLKGVIRKLTASDVSALQHWWMILAGMTFGAFAGSLHKMARIAKQNGGPGSLSQFYTGRIGGTAMDILLLGSAALAGCDIWRRARELMQVGAELTMLTEACWLVGGIVFGMLAGYLYVMIVIPDK